MQHDICAFGDYLIDFTPFPQQSSQNPVVEINVGGTSANLAACCARLGLSVLAVGKVGDDALGAHIRNLLACVGVDTTGLLLDEEGRATTQTLVSLIGGERSFSFFRKYAADICLPPEQVDIKAILACRAIAFTGMSFHDEPIKRTSFMLLEQARRQACFCAIDVNYRQKLWDSEEKFIQTMLQVIPYLDFYKSSEEEALMITRADTVEEAAEKLMRYGPGLVAISCGSKGAYYRCAQGEGKLSTYDTQKVDTTGAGDCFFGAMLYQILQSGGLKKLGYANIEKMVDFANAAGAVSITRRGGAASMPCVQQVVQCQENTARLEMAW